MTDLTPAEQAPQAGLVEERNQLLADVKWMNSEFGVDHWRNCDSVGCHRCDGHWEIQERWQHASAIDPDRSEVAS